MKIKNILYTCIIFLITSCGAGVSDSIIDLGNGFYYLFEGGDGNMVFYSTINNTSIEKIIIGYGVESYRYNKKYILIERKITESIVKDSIKNYLSSTYSFVSLFKKDKKSLENSVFKNRVFNKNDALIYENLYHKEYRNKNSLKDQNILEITVDSIISKDNKLKSKLKEHRLFYIIDKNSHQLFCFSSRNNFDSKKKKLGINLSYSLHL